MIRIAVFGFLLVFGTTSWAQVPPPAPKQDLKALEKKLEQEEQAKTEIEEEISQVKGEAKTLQKKMVSLGSSIQKNEAELAKIDAKIAELEEKQEEAQDTYEEDRKAFSELASALHRISRIPPEAALLNPDQSEQMVQGSIILKSILPQIEAKARELREALAEYDIINEELNTQKEQQEKKTAKLEKEYKKLEALTSAKEKTLSLTQKELDAQNKRVAQISREATSLSDLMKKLEQEENERTRNVTKKKSFKKRIFSSATGQLPIKGVIKIQYKEPDAFGAPSEGLSIQGTPNALIVAPMDGVIKFTGNFKNYGQMIIIEHGHYHSLISGFEKINARVGQSVVKGEPIGTLRSKLYYELRQDGKSVDPAKKISGI